MPTYPSDLVGKQFGLQVVESYAGESYWLDNKLLKLWCKK